MAPRTFDPPTDGGAPPLPPIDLPAFDVDEGPMRSELRRQIAVLERELSALVAKACPWEPRQTSPARGPAVLGGAGLEQIRDELMRAVQDLAHRIETGDVAAPAADQDPRPPRRGLRRLLTRR